VYDGVLFNGAEKDFNIKEASRGNLGMQDSDIWSHSHRMYLIGENSINFPWYITKDFPNRALDGENKEKFLTFLKRKQILLDWTESEKNVFYLANVLFPPMASWLHNNIRAQHFQALEDSLYECFDKDFWDDTAHKTIRVSATCH